MHQKKFWNFLAIFSNNLRVKTQLPFFVHFFFKRLYFRPEVWIGQNFGSARSAYRHVSSQKNFGSHISNIDNNLRHGVFQGAPLGGPPWGGGGAPKFRFFTKNPIFYNVKSRCPPPTGGHLGKTPWSEGSMGGGTPGSPLQILIAISFHSTQSVQYVCDTPPNLALLSFVF